jgi:hypothetical protein
MLFSCARFDSGNVGKERIISEYEEFIRNDAK